MVINDHIIEITAKIVVNRFIRKSCVTYINTLYKLKNAQGWEKKFLKGVRAKTLKCILLFGVNLSTLKTNNSCLSNNVIVDMFVHSKTKIIKDPIKYLFTNIVYKLNCMNDIKKMEIIKNALVRLYHINKDDISINKYYIVINKHKHLRKF